MYTKNKSVIDAPSWWWSMLSPLYHCVTRGLIQGSVSGLSGMAFLAILTLLADSSNGAGIKGLFSFIYRIYSKSVIHRIWKKLFASSSDIYVIHLLQVFHPAGSLGFSYCLLSYLASSASTRFLWLFVAAEQPGLGSHAIREHLGYKLKERKEEEVYCKVNFNRRLLRSHLRICV